jgi:hypothetical protein
MHLDNPFAPADIRDDDRALPGPITAPKVAQSMGKANVVAVIWVAALAYRDDLINDSRPRVEVSETLVDWPQAKPAVVFLFEDPGAELASAVPVGVARVARRRAGLSRAGVPRDLAVGAASRTGRANGAYADRADGGGAAVGHRFAHSSSTSAWHGPSSGHQQARSRPRRASISARRGRGVHSLGLASSLARLSVSHSR